MAKSYQVPAANATKLRLVASNNHARRMAPAAQVRRAGARLARQWHRRELREAARRRAERARRRAAAARAAAQASQEAAPPSPAPPPPSPPTATAGGVPPAYAACVISHESGGNPRAVNPSSGAGGLVQFLPSTWAGTPWGPSYPGGAQTAPASVQLEAFAWLYARDGPAPWSSDGC